VVPTDDLLVPAQRRRVPIALPRLGFGGLLSVVATLQLLVAMLVLGVHGIPGVLGGDFIAYYGGGKQALAGDWSHLYDLAAQLPYQRALLQHSGLPAGGPSMIPFDYPPPAALLFLPFALVPARVAAMLWLVVNLSLVGVSALFLARRAPRGQFIGTAIRRSPTAALWLFILLPVDWGLLSGQPVGPILLLAELSFVALVARNDGRAGIWLGLLAVFKPQLVLVPLLGLLVLRRPRAVAGAALTGLVLLAISLALVGIRGLLSYVALLRQIDPALGSTAYSIRTEAMVNWRAWIVAIPGIGAQAALLLTTAAAVVTVGAALLLCARRHSPSQIAPAYLALTAAGLVAGYHSHYQDLVVLLPPAVGLLAAGPRSAFAGEGPRSAFAGEGPLSAFGISPPSLGESQHQAIGSPSPTLLASDVPSGPRPLQARSSPPGLGERPGERARPPRRSLPLATAAVLFVAPSLAWLLLGVFALAWLPVWTFVAVPGLLFLIVGAGRRVTAPSPAG